MQFRAACFTNLMTFLFFHCFRVAAVQRFRAGTHTLQGLARTFGFFACGSGSARVRSNCKVSNPVARTLVVDSITPQQYRNHKFIAAFDTEKAAMRGASFTGSDIKQGSLMTLKMRSTAASQYMPDTVYIVLHFDSIVSIRDTGVEVFE